MRFITPKMHGILDLLIAAVLFATPLIFGFSPIVAKFSYAFGLAYLLFAFLTDFNAGPVKLIPFTVHEVIEIGAAIMCIVLSYTVFKQDVNGKLFYAIFGNCLILTWAFTDYKSKKKVLFA